MDAARSGWMVLRVMLPQMVVLSRDSDAYSDIRVIGQAIVSIE